MTAPVTAGSSRSTAPGVSGFSPETPGVPREDLLRALETVRDPELDEPITSLGFVAACTVSSDGDAQVRLRLPTYFCAPNFAYLMVADADDGAPLLIDPATGAPVVPAAVPLHLRKAQVTRVSIEANSGICRGMLRHRYNNTQGQGETVPPGD